MYICPFCHSKSVGKIGSNQFYCWDCCIEFLEQKDDVLMFEVTDDGGLSVLEDAIGIIADPKNI